MLPLQEKSSGCWRKKEFPSWSWSLCPWMACELVVGTEMLSVGWGSLLSPPSIQAAFWPMSSLPKAWLGPKSG